VGWYRVTRWHSVPPRSGGGVARFLSSKEALVVAVLLVAAIVAIVLWRR
jgi:hypothetical protein